MPPGVAELLSAGSLRIFQARCQKPQNCLEAMKLSQVGFIYFLKYVYEINEKKSLCGWRCWLSALTFMCRRLRRKRSSSLCWRAMKLTAAYSSSAEKTKSRQTAIQMSMALT